MTIDNVKEISKKNIYMKNNSLIKSKYELTSMENKLYMFLSDKLKAKGNIYENTKIRFKRQEVFKFLNPKDQQPARLSKIFSKLRKRSIFIHEIDNDGLEYWGEFGFISYYKYFIDTDEFEVEMNTRVTELIMEHYINSGGYTPINLDVLYKLNSIYAQRFYELIRLWSWTDSPIIYNIDDLRSYLLLDNKKSYNTYANMKNKVIKPAISELNESNIFKIDFEEIKEGKKVVAIKLFVKDLDNRIYFKKNNAIAISSQTNSNVDINFEDENFYIPNPQVFTKGALRLFKIDFVEKDFKDEDMKNLFERAVSISMEKDNVDKINPNTYCYFKTTLTNMINDFDFKKGYEDAENFFK